MVRGLYLNRAFFLCAYVNRAFFLCVLGPVREQGFSDSGCLLLSRAFFLRLIVSCKVLYPYRDSEFERSYCSEKNLLLTKVAGILRLFKCQ